ncbi:enoyl-CoA hydratase family protein [Rhodococcus erythropolis]|uniref:oxepin-CoA hydrolase, alternative type n=1 Tax=Rhodococcus erythropolis TaxID=1833 RepID=UPI00210AC021|nr:enoyl-CoA hydratase family protein [Rhodococcus erythropolis]MCQ4129194.1 enoyl-CoA hydratase family protein [Rhodococcus erythropolis]
MTSEVLLSRPEGPVLVLTINNPTARNSIGPEFFEAATDALALAASDPTVGAVVFAGAGGFFSSGGNLNQLAENRLLGKDVRRARIELLHQFIRSVRESPKPILSAVEGGAAGAGMAVAVACDLVISARNAFFSASYIKAGLSPDGGITSVLSESVSRQTVTEMCLTGDRLSAERMKALGIVTRVTDPGGAEATAIELGRQLASGPERATARILVLCRNAHSLSLEQQLDREAEAMVVSQGDPEAAEGIAAVLERRPANFAALRGDPYAPRRMGSGQNPSTQSTQAGR